MCSFRLTELRELLQKDTVNHSSIQSFSQRNILSLTGLAVGQPLIDRKAKKLSHSQPGAIQVILDLHMNCERKSHYLWETHM